MTGMRQRPRIPAWVRLERDKRNRLAGSISVAGDVSGPGFSRYHVEKQNRSPCRRSVTTPPSTIVSTVDHEKTGNLEIREGVNQDHLARYDTPTRSEEHTYDLQSLMRISYALFCLKKKNKKAK